MTLSEALAYARDQQPALLAARARVRAAQADAQVPRGEWAPRLAATLQAFAATEENTTASYAGVPGVDLPRIGGTPAGGGNRTPYPSTLAAIGVRQEIFDFGRIAAGSAAADAALDAERDRADRAGLDVSLEVEEAYYAVHAAQGVLAAAGAARQRAQLDFQTAQAGVRAGMRKPIELTRAAADLARFELGRVRAQAGLESARALFAAVVGVPDRVLDAAGEPPAPVAAPALDQAIDTAIAHDPSLREEQARIAEEQARARAIGSGLRPDLRATATFSGREGGAPASSGADRSGLVPGTPNWDVGLIFSWPIYDRSILAEEEASRQRVEVRRAELAEAQQRLQAGVQQAWLDLQAAGQALPALRKALDASRANYDQAEARFGAGMGTSVELADAQALLAESEVQLALGQFEDARARARLAREMGEQP